MASFEEKAWKAELNGGYEFDRSDAVFGAMDPGDAEQRQDFAHGLRIVEVTQVDTIEPVSPEELSELMAHGAKAAVEQGELSYPPDVEQVLEAATDFYSTYLEGTSVDRVEAVDRYAAALIEELERVHGYHLPDDGLELYFAVLHDQANDEYALAA